MLRKKNFFILIILIQLMNVSVLHARTVLEDLFKIYTTYKTVNSGLWLTGDIGAEKRLGKELQMWMKLTSRREKDKKTNDYVKKIFYRLLPNYNTHGLRCDVTVLKGNTVNAFVIPGGHVYVYQGLIDFCQSDDELATIIAHELGHMERRHSLKNFRLSTAAVALLNKAVKNTRDRDTWGALLTTLTLMKFSRKQEDEADDIGQFRMAKAGYNPNAQVAVWEKFLNHFGNTNGLDRYLSSHPPSSARIDNARNNLKKMNYTVNTTHTNTRNILSIIKPNYLNNPSFEKHVNGKLQNWQLIEGNGSISAETSYSGTHSFKLDSGNRLAKSRFVSDFIQISPASKFDFSGWVKTQDGSQNIAIGVELYSKNKRIRSRKWNIFPSNPIPAKWTKITGTIENGKNYIAITKPTMYMKIIVQNGLMSTGSAWFDDLRLKVKDTEDPENLIDGDFEYVQASGTPTGIINTNEYLKRDLSKYHKGYASLRIDGSEGREMGVVFTPIPLSKFPEPDYFKKRQINGSFHFFSNAKINGRVIVEYLDENGNPLSRQLCKVEFGTRVNQWLATSFNFKLELQDGEKELARWISIKVVAVIPDKASLWIDDFILQ